MTSQTSVTGSDEGNRLWQLATLFLKLGCTAFGGPAAHIAMTREEVVQRRQWLTEQEFLDMISAANLIPGPNSTEVAIHIGRERAGVAGLLVAGMCFIIPSAVMVAAIAWAYVKYSSLPAVDHVMNGIKPMIIAIVLQALIGLSKSALKNAAAITVFAAALIGCIFKCDEILLLLVCGGICLAWSWSVHKHRVTTGGAAMVSVLLAGTATAYWLIVRIASGTEGVPEFSLAKLFWYFVKIGSVLYGSGYVLLAFLRTDLVDHWHWLTSAQLLDATAIGQVTPGPVFTTAAFIGYLLGGPAGAAVATLGIFTPAFVFVAATAPIIMKMRGSPLTGAFLDGINSGSLALMTFVTWQLGLAAITGPVAAVELAIAVLALWRFKVNASWLVLGGAMAGLVFYR